MNRTSTDTPKLSSSERSRMNRDWGSWRIIRQTSCVAVVENVATGDRLTVKETAPNVFRVRSHRTGLGYTVNVAVTSCNCKDATSRQRECYHGAACRGYQFHRQVASLPKRTLAQLNAEMFG